MSSPSSDATAVSPSSNPLNVYTAQQWKRVCINKALELNAYGILMGTESEPTSDAKLKANYQEWLSKLIGYLRSTLDHSQTDTILGKVSILDAKGTWEALLSAYEPKTSGSRTSVLQELIALCKGDEGHEC